MMDGHGLVRASSQALRLSPFPHQRKSALNACKANMPYSGALRTVQASVSTKLTFRGYHIDHVLAGCIRHVGQRSIPLLSQQKWLLRWLKRQVEEVARKTAPEAYLTDI